MYGDSDFSHAPVLCKEVLDMLCIRPNGIYIDCTAGGAGHSKGILHRLSAKGLLISLDKDDDAISFCRSQREKEKNKDRWHIVKSSFSDFPEVLRQKGIEKIDGLLADLGVSSHQLDTPRRGFSYVHDGPLDMRMDTSSETTAATVVNRYSEENLVRIFRQYGEEKFAGRIAAAIVKYRAGKQIESTGELSDIVLASLPSKAKNGEQHPARRIYQAIRIEVNRELAEVESLLSSSVDVLNEKGRLAVISFHSLEDRLVKDTFRDWENPCICPREFPVCVCGKIKKGSVITKKALIASPEEQKRNSRSRSAKLRVFERRIQI